MREAASIGLPSLPRLGLAALCLAFFAGPATASDDDDYQGMSVRVAKAEKKCLSDILPVSGVLVPKASIEVRPDRDGFQVSEVLVEAGDSVGAGQILARLVQPIGAPVQTATVKSPVAGVAIGVNAIVGSYVSPAMPDPMFKIIVNGELELKGEIASSKMSRLRVGQPATLYIMGLNQLTGEVTSIDTSVDAVTQQGSVRISLKSDPLLRPGAFARADIDTGQRCEVTLPLSAVLYGPEGAVVQVVTEKHIETRRVSIGLLSGGLAQIREGVNSGDEVVATAGSFLREGDIVRPVQQGAQP